jgi:hypothetical protein
VLIEAETLKNFSLPNQSIFNIVDMDEESNSSIEFDY